MVHLAQLLSQCVMREESPRGKMAAGQDASATGEMDKIVEMKDNVHVGPFQAEILKGRIVQVPAHDMHLMVVPIRHADVKSGKVHPTAPRITSVAHLHTTLSAGSKQVSIVVQNMMDSAIFLKKGVSVVYVISVTLVPPVEVPLEQVEGTQAPRE